MVKARLQAGRCSWACGTPQALALLRHIRGSAPTTGADAGFGLVISSRSIARPAWLRFGLFLKTFYEPTASRARWFVLPADRVHGKSRPHIGLHLQLNLDEVAVHSRSFNPLVAGSNPARPTKISQEAHEFRFVGFLFSGLYLIEGCRANLLHADRFPCLSLSNHNTSTPEYTDHST
jgi:hypothetical protein